jgi:hypothetical protein
MNNNKGYEYNIDTDAQGVFIEVYKTDEQGKRGEMHLSIFVNANEGETVDDAIAACEIELYDGAELLSSNFSEDDLKRQRQAFQWIKESYSSIQDFKGNL